MLSEVITKAQKNAAGNQGKAKRATSKDIMSSFEQRLVRVELTIGKLVNKIEDSKGCIEGLGEELREEMQGALNRAADSLSQRGEAVEQHGDALEALVETLCKELDEVKEELAVSKATATWGAVAIQPAWVDVPRLKEFKGERSAKEVDNFLWSME